MKRIEEYENYLSMKLAYHEIVEQIVMGDSEFMPQSTTAEKYIFVDEFMAENIDHDLYSLRDRIVAFKDKALNPTETEPNTKEEKVYTLRQEILDAIKQKYTFNANDLTLIIREMKDKFVSLDAKSFVFKVDDDCTSSPELCDDNDADIYLGASYLPELQKFLDDNDFKVFKEEHRDNLCFIHVNLED